MIKIIVFLTICVVVMHTASTAQAIKNTSWKAYFDAPINDTATLTVGNDSTTITNTQGMTVVMSAIHIAGDTITIKDVTGPIACPPDATGTYTYTIATDKMVLHLVSDDCDGRASAISNREWTKVK